MEMFNLGLNEVLLILMIFFIVLGPGKIKKLAYDLGDIIRKLNKNGLVKDVVHTADEIRDFPRKIVDEAINTDQMFSEIPESNPIEFKHPEKTLEEQKDLP